jgi:hypothetical protein
MHNVAKGPAVADGLKSTGTTVCFFGTVAIAYPLLDLFLYRDAVRSHHTQWNVLEEASLALVVYHCTGRIRDLSHLP